MARLAFLVVLTAIIVLAFLGITFLKYSYRLLPIGDSKEFVPMTFADWQIYRNPSNQFQVSLPAIAQNAKQTLTDPKTKQTRQYDMYVAQKSNGTVYMVSLIRFPGTKESPEILQKTVVNDLMAANPVNQLKNMQIGDFNQFKTLDFSIQNNSMLIDGRTFMDGDTLYLLTAVFPAGLQQPADYEHFIQSFELAPLPKLMTPDVSN